MRNGLQPPVLGGLGWRAEEWGKESGSGGIPCSECRWIPWGPLELIEKHSIPGFSGSSEPNMPKLPHFTADLHVEFAENAKELSGWGKLVIGGGGSNTFENIYHVLSLEYLIIFLMMKCF